MENSNKQARVTVKFNLGSFTTVSNDMSMEINADVSVVEKLTAAVAPIVGTLFSGNNTANTNVQEAAPETVTTGIWDEIIARIESGKYSATHPNAQLNLVAGGELLYIGVPYQATLYKGLTPYTIQLGTGTEWHSISTQPELSEKLRVLPVETRGIILDLLGGLLPQESDL